MVDAISVTPAGNVTTLPTKKRYKRRPVTGGHGLEVNDNGEFNRGTNRVPKKGKHNHLIHPGTYSGPVPPAYGAYLINPDDDSDGKRHVTHERFVADLVAYEFLGPPPAGWADTLVIHLDGDRSNAAPDNLCYVVDEAKVEAKRRKMIAALMAVEPRGPEYKPRARDPYGVKTRNVHTAYCAALKERVEAARHAAPVNGSDRREGADLTRNPAYFSPDKPRMFGPIAS